MAFTTKKISSLLLFLFLLSSNFLGFAQVTIWSEDFASYSDGTQQGLGTPPKWTINPTIGYSDYFEVRSNLFEGSNMDQEGVFTTETIDISSFLNVTVSVEVSELGNSKASDYVNVFYKIDGGIETSFENNGSNTGNFTTATARTNVLNESSLIVVIKVKNDKSNKYHRFDNIVVEGTPNSPPSCTTPISPTDGQTNFALDGDLTWNSAVGATSYEINFGTDSPPTNIENGTDPGNVLSYTPSATLDFSTTYYWQIVPKNDYGSAIGCSVWSFTTGQYCSGGSSTEDEYIDRVQIETIDNSNSGYSVNGYGDFTSLSTDLAKGQTGVQLTLNFGVAYTDDDIGVWVDWNQDGDFNDTGENVVCQIGITSLQETYSFDVPASALLGSTTMRIRMKYDDDDCGTPCGITTYGEVEDYTINVISACTDPDIPTLTSSSNPICSGDNVTLTITGNLNDATLWHIYTGSCGGTQIGTTATSSFVVNNVTTTTTYYVRGEGNCVTPGSCGNVTLTVEDTEDPTITCATPAPAYSNDGRECYYTIPDNSLDPLATGDNCTIASVINDFNSTNTLNGAQFSVGTTTVIWIVTDAAGNTATCQYDVVVNDDENPTITCPANISTNPDAGLCTYSGGIGTPVTTDNCPGETTNNNAPATFPMGNTIVTWTVTDAVGNTATCQQTVTVEPAEIIDIEVVDLGNSCQSGETGSTTTITWDINLLQGSNNWTYDYKINDGTTDVQTGTNVSATGNIQISYTMNNATATDKTYTITITNVKDNCGVAETETGNNSDTVTMFGVPATSDISTN